MNDRLINDQHVKVAVIPAAGPVPPPPVDFGVTAADYAAHRQGHPPALFDRLAAHGVGLPGHDVVDLGTGTGAAARALAARGARVTGVDPSTALLTEAARLASRDGVEVTWRHGCAEDTGLAAACADDVVVAQAWHWFDRPRAAAEARRLLRPGGAIAIIHTDWLPLPGSVIELTTSIVLRHRAGAPLPYDASLFHHGIYPYWPDDLAAAGFGAVEIFGFDLPVRYTHAGWLGRMRAAALVTTMPPQARVACGEELTRALAMGFPDPVDVPHRCFAVIARR
jgi:SAM-dependent methyltransferase